MALGALVGAAILALLAPSTHAQSFSCVQTKTPKGFTLDCSQAATVTVVPPPGPPADPQPPPPPPPAATACDRLDPVFSARFLATLARTPPLHINDYTFFVSRGLTPDELACARERSVPGMEPAAPRPADHPAGSGERPTGFTLWKKGYLFGNQLVAGVTYDYPFDTEPGERVWLKSAEVSGTLDIIMVRSRVITAAGAELVPWQTHGRNSTPYEFNSPGGRLVFQLVPSVSSPLGVQRN